MSKVINYAATGGAVQALEGSIYLTRQADEDLLKSCQAGTFTYILAPRQIGKTSLIYHAIEKLGKLGVRTAYITLELLGAETTNAEQWYLGFIVSIADQLIPGTDVTEWWETHNQFSYSQRFNLFFEKILLSEIEEQVIIFVDEIDRTLRMKFTDDFFIAVRSFHNQRGNLLQFKRLTFVLAGVATPGDLIRDPNSTPFNIGKRVEMLDFTFEEALALADGLNLPMEEAQQVLRYILKWTGGHPYLTQQLCQSVVEKNRKNWSEAQINDLVGSIFFGEKDGKIESDSNLQFVRDMLIRRLPEGVSKEQVITVYHEVWRSKRRIVDEAQSLIKNHLKLSGVAKRVSIYLEVRNQVYSKVFGKSWLKENLPPIKWLQRIKQAALPIAISVVIAAMMTVLAIFAFYQQGQAQNAQATAEAQQQEANTQRITTQFYLEQAQNAQATAQAENFRAQQQTRIVLSQKLGVQARLLLKQDFDLALLLAIEANNISQTVEARSNLFEILQSNPLKASLSNFWSHSITSVALSLDGNLIAVGDEIGLIHLWDIANQKLTTLPFTAAPNKTYNPIQSVAFSPNNKILSFATSINRIFLFDLSTGKELKAPDSGEKVLFSHNGNLLVFTEGLTINLWDVINQRLIGQPIIGNTNTGIVFTLSPDDKILAAIGYDETIRLWDVATQNLISTYRDVNIIHSSLTFSPDSKIVAFGKSDRTVNFFEITTQKIKTQSIQDLKRIPVQMVFRPDNQLLAIEGDDGVISFWDISVEKLLSTEYSTSNNSDWGNRSGTLIFSSTGKSLVSVNGVAVRIWDTSSLSLSGKSIEGGGPVAYSPDGKLFASANAENMIQLWDVTNGTRLDQLKVKDTASSSAITQLVFSPNSKLLAFVRYGLVRLWNVESKKLVGLAGLLGVDNFYSNIAFSPDGKILALLSGNSISFRDTTTGLPIGNAIFDQSGLSHDNLTFSPDGKTLAVGGCSRRQVIGCEHGDIQLLDVNDLDNITLSQRILTATAELLSFSPDGKILASGSTEKIQLWDVKNGKPIGPALSSPASFLVSLAFSPTGEFLATLGDNGIIRLWDIVTGRSLGQLQGDSIVGGVKSQDISFSPDGKMLAYSNNKIVRFWPTILTLDPLKACKLVGRNLALDEWKEFLESEPYHKTCSTIAEATATPSATPTSGK